jgi:hypothetical protein
MTRETARPITSDEINRSVYKIRGLGMTFRTNPPLDHLCRTICSIQGKSKVPAGDKQRAALIRDFLTAGTVRNTVIEAPPMAPLVRTSWRTLVPATRLHDGVPSVMANTRTWRDGRTEAA